MNHRQANESFSRPSGAANEKVLIRLLVFGDIIAQFQWHSGVLNQQEKQKK